ncbi:hypothetical protein NicSoilB8_39570 [Arthrobacter sp. NicSoilB8]|nr:hypothetical protein NicSoilB8_39570 [Arthrobacter sp. NicSoilB8]
MTDTEGWRTSAMGKSPKLISAMSVRFKLVYRLQGESEEAYAAAFPGLVGDSARLSVE